MDVADKDTSKVEESELETAIQGIEATKALTVYQRL